jgi:ketosteroid isomerase-like protein
VLDAAVVVELRDGRIVRVQGYMDRAAALAAAGV